MTAPAPAQRLPLPRSSSPASSRRPRPHRAPKAPRPQGSPQLGPPRRLVFMATLFHWTLRNRRRRRISLQSRSRCPPGRSIRLVPLPGVGGGILSFGAADRVEQLAQPRQGLPPLRGERSPDRRPGLRGAALRPRSGDRAPGRQAVELAPGPSGDRLGHRLRVGEGGRREGPDAHRRLARHAAVHGARAVPGAVRRPERHLRAGAHALRDAGDAPGVRGLRPQFADPQSDQRGPPAAAQNRRTGAARPGDDRRQGD